MPNHITNLITAPTAVIESILRGHTPEEIQSFKDDTERLREHEPNEWFDARRKEEMLKRRETEAEAMLIERIVDFAVLIPQPDNLETGGCSGTHDEGVICWLDWNVNNWGTKWNGYETKIENNEDGTSRLNFQTAWSHPAPVIVALSNKFPDVEIEVSYADEDLGYNLGKYSILGGVTNDNEQFEHGSEEALEFAAQLCHGESYAELQKEWEA